MILHRSTINRLERELLDEAAGNELQRAFARGVNTGIRRAIDVLRIEAALSELAHAPAIRTVRSPFGSTDSQGGIE